MATKKKMLQAAAGNAGGAGEVLNVEDVFSTYLYEGNGSTQTITNGIDLDGEGGLVWIKGRPTSLTGHVLTDTVRGATKQLQSHTTSAEEIVSNGLTAFASDGFSIGSDANYSRNGDGFASWTFRKAPKFFDVVTYTGTGSAQNISHDLDADVGFMIVKRLDSASTWRCWHRGLPSGNDVIHLNEAGPYETNSDIWSGTAPTSTQFSVGTNSNVNASGGTYVAYLFAHNDGDGEFGADADADIIKCGSYTGNGSTTGPEIDLGFEPQFVIAKGATVSDHWFMYDSMRGFPTSGALELRPNEADAEAARSYMAPTSTGFKLIDSNGQANSNGETYIYIAIRRGTKVPESGTEVFKPVQFDGTKFSTGFPVDFAIAGNAAGTDKWYFQSRLQGPKVLSSASAAAELGSGSGKFDIMDGYGTGFSTAYYSTAFRRAPNFFDVVAYTGDGVAGRTVPHNLGVAPEMMWVKCRSAAEYWTVYHSGLNVNGDNAPETDYLFLNATVAAGDSNVMWNDTAPTETSFTLGTNGTVNQSPQTYIAYLFATLPGVSKCGSYTGNGSSQTIDCGFTSGARFILIKRTDSTGDWYVWDTERGIVAGNDPHLSLNTTASEVTSDDSIDPDNSGFIVNQVSATNINVSSASYIYYAVS